MIHDDVDQQLPDPPARVHFVGIGGIGMSGLARLLHDRGYLVTGSDSVQSELTDQLVSEGIAVETEDHDRSEVATADVVVRTAAVGLDHPEIQMATDRGVPILKRAELLGGLSNPSISIAVAGSHGKSTTSSMIVTALQALGSDPSYSVGAVLSATGSNAGNGSGPHFVVEADEYDRSFLTLNPTCSVITNIEFDHPDIYRDFDDYRQAFLSFANRTRPGGSLVTRADNPGGRAFIEELPDRLRECVVTFGSGPDLDWSLRRSETGSDWVVKDRACAEYPMKLAVPGFHNALNATAALAVLTKIGFDPVESVAALSTYRGIGRRFELKGARGGVSIVDDYAHHPTEIAATLQAARDRYRGQRVWAVFQPHTYSRTQHLRDEFAQSLGAADQVVVLDVYAAREENEGRVSDADLRLMAGSSGLRSSGLADTVDAVAPLLRKGDVVLTLGAGSVTGLGPLLLDRLAADEGS